MMSKPISIIYQAQTNKALKVLTTKIIPKKVHATVYTFLNGNSLENWSKSSICYNYKLEVANLASINNNISISKGYQYGRNLF
jgi:hypothetical protein